MISTITLTVDHGEDTDSVQEFVELVSKSIDERAGEQWLQSMGFDFRVTDYDMLINI